MIILADTDQTLELVSADAGSVDWSVTWIDTTATTYLPGGAADNTTAAETDLTIVAAPAASTVRKVLLITLCNLDPATQTVYVQKDIATVNIRCSPIFELLENETAIYADGEWKVYTAEGKPKTEGGVNTAEMNAAISLALPSGVIMMWSGTVATIPTGWIFCDGTGGTPDLTDKFIVGAVSDDAGVAKSNIEGSLNQTGGVTGHSHSAHADLTHAGGAVGDHTGLTHGLTIADHPDLTHAALSHAASTFSHADHSIASVTHTHAAVTLTHADHSIAGLTHADHSVATFTGSQAGHSVSHPQNTYSVQTGTASRITITPATGSTASAATGTHSHAAITLTHPSHPATTITHADHSVASFSGTHPATTLTHADHSFPSLAHQAIGTHKGTDYGTHAFTAPAAHGVAGTLTHSFTQPNDHAISAHDTVSNVPVYFALAFIMKA